MVFFSLARKAPQKGSPRKDPMKRLEPGSGIFYNWRMHLTRVEILQPFDFKPFLGLSAKY
jgi:hypothetical protein